MNDSKWIRKIVFIAAALILPAIQASAQEISTHPAVVSVMRIWDQPGHSAFTDLIRFQGDLYCTFREGNGHIPRVTPQGNGTIRVLRSGDEGVTWKSFALIAEEGTDLRDPKLGTTADGRLMLNAGASFYEGRKRLGVETRVAFLEIGQPHFGALHKVSIPESIQTGSDWLWRPTWHDGWAWGAVVQIPRVPKNERKLHLVKSRDGMTYEHVATLEVDQPSETTLRFLDDDILCAMIRRVGAEPATWIGTARRPYRDWKFQVTTEHIGGPNFIQLPDGRWLAGGRNCRGPTSTGLWWIEIDNGVFKKILNLPSGGDTSYPGFVIDQDESHLLVSYYSSHEGKAAIYLATLRLDLLRESVE